MTAPITKAKKRQAYRAAVQAVLTEFYRTPELDSRKLVAAWWKQLSHSSSFRTGIFMHSEPMNTAADLIHAEAIPITSDLQHAYEHVLRQSRDKVLRGRQEHEDSAIVTKPQSNFVPVTGQRKLAFKVARPKKKQEQKYVTARV